MGFTAHQHKKAWKQDAWRYNLTILLSLKLVKKLSVNFAEDDETHQVNFEIF